MKWIILTILALILVIIQADFSPFFSISGIGPNLILIVSLSLLIFRNFREAIFFGFFGGIFSDFMAPNSHFALGAISLISTLIVLGFISDFFKKQDFLIIGAIMGFSTFLYNVFLGGGIYLMKLTGIIGRYEFYLADFPKVIFVQILYNLFVGLVIFAFLKYARHYNIR